MPSFCRAGYVMSYEQNGWDFVLGCMDGFVSHSDPEPSLNNNEAPEPRPRVYANGDGEQASTKVARNRKRQTAKFSADRCTRYE